MYGDISAVIDGQTAAALPNDVSPLLKIHGCRVQDRANMVWAPGQLTSEPVQSRIAHSKTWLSNNLVNRDILIVGFWTDWDYLNDVLAKTLDAVNPSRVVVVSPASTAEFQGKAPELFELGERSQIAFQHMQVSGDHFLDQLRRRFSMTFVRRVLHSGAQEFELQTSAAPDPDWLEPPDLDCDAFWRIRRDLEGCLPSEPAKECGPPDGESLIGLTLLQLRAAGAVAEGAYWLINNQRVRVVRALNKALHRVEEEFTGELAPAVAPDIAIAVGAEELSLAANIARPEPSSSVARGQKGRWLTRQKAVEVLGL